MSPENMNAGGGVAKKADHFHFLSLRASLSKCLLLCCKMSYYVLHYSSLV